MELGDQKQLRSFCFSFNEIQFSCKQVTLQLFRSFNTAHSSTQQRHNFFVKISFNGVSGCGQCGLPPKKPGCYYADIEDCFIFAKNYKDILQASQPNTSTEILQDLTKIDGKEYFKDLIQSQNKKHFMPLLNNLRFLKDYYCRPGRSAVQFAILDLWTRLQGIGIMQATYGKEYLLQKHIAYSFYTVSQQDHSQMLMNAKNALKYTSHIKIKYSCDPKGLINLLKLFKEHEVGKKWIIDLNCSWNVEAWLQFAEKIEQQQQLLSKILYIQQPYPLTLNETEKQRWVQCKIKSKLKFVADQSFSDFEDLNKIVSLSHCINIKIEKCAGFINAIKAALMAKSIGIQIMFGSMVSTQLGCAQCFQLYPLSTYFDIDGSLLVKSPSFQGGFRWGDQGQLIKIGNKGLGFDDDFYTQF